MLTSIFLYFRTLRMWKAVNSLLNAFLEESTHLLILFIIFELLCFICTQVVVGNRNTTKLTY